MGDPSIFALIFVKRDVRVWSTRRAGATLSFGYTRPDCI